MLLELKNCCRTGILKVLLMKGGDKRVLPPFKRLNLNFRLRLQRRHAIGGSTRRSSVLPLHFVADLKDLGNSFIVCRELRPKLFRGLSVNLCPISVYYIRNSYSLRR